MSGACVRLYATAAVAGPWDQTTRCGCTQPRARCGQGGQADSIRLMAPNLPWIAWAAGGLDIAKELLSPMSAEASTSIDGSTFRLIIADTNLAAFIELRGAVYVRDPAYLCTCLMQHIAVPTGTSADLGVVLQV